MRPEVKWRVGREARPNALFEIVGAVLRDALVDTLRHLPRHEPLHHAIGDTGAHPLKDLDRGLVGYAFRQELRDDFAGLIVGADQRRDFENEAARGAIVIKPRLRIETPIWKPIGEQDRKSTRLNSSH